MKPEPCPRCLAPAREDGHPDCACAVGAETETESPAESAAESPEAETFDQLHTRPYVSLHNEETPDDEEAAGPTVAPAAASIDPTPPGEPTETEPPPPVPFLGILEEEGTDPAEPTDTGRRKTGLLVLGAVVAVAAVAAIGAGVLGGNDGSTTTDTAAVPNAQSGHTSSASAHPSAPDGATAAGPSDGASADPGTSPGAKAGKSAKDAAKDIAASAAADLTGKVDGDAAAPSATAADGGPAPTNPAQGASPSGPPVLREGDTGPEVVELQKRMSQLLLQYVGLPDGTYDAGVERAVARYQKSHHITGDPSGVYGADTRADLESRTREP